MLRLVLAALVLSAPPTLAQSVSDCDWRARADAIVEPWEDNSRTFAGGAVRLAKLDTIEPAAGALHLLVVSPPLDEVGGPQCKVVSWTDQMGFAALEFAALASSYDAARGLQFDVPVRFFDPDLDFSNVARLKITLNQSTGAISAEMVLGGE